MWVGLRQRIKHFTRFTDVRWHYSVPFEDRYDRFLFFIREFYKWGPPYEWLKGIALFPGIRWNRPATLVDGSYLTEDGRVVSNRQAASWARKKSATLRMKLSQGLMDLV